MKIAICILNWNGKNLLKKFLPSIIDFSKNHIIYLIDNNSQDSSVLFVNKYFPVVKIIKNPINLGFSAGYNLGLKQVKEKVFCLINSDVRVKKNWIEPIVDLFNKDKNIGIIQPKIINENNQKYFEYAGAGGGKIDFFGYPYCRGRILYKLEKDIGQYNDTIPIFWASGACFFIKKKLFWKFKGFDETLFAHMEEIDLCWRINNNFNNKIYYCGKSEVYHVGGATLNKYSRNKLFLNFRNNLFILLKNLPQYSWIYILLFRLFLDLMIGLLLLIFGKWSYICSIIQAYYSFCKNFFLIYKKRKPGKKKYYQTFSVFLLKEK